VTQEEFARQILEIAIGANNAEARCGMVLDACEAAEAAGMKRENVIAMLVMALVSTGTIVLNASRSLAEAQADEPRGQILR
jgi:hypothetical protein